MAIAMKNRLTSDSSGTGMGCGDTSTSQPLTLLSSIAAAMSDEPIENTVQQQQQQQQLVKEYCTTRTAEVLNTSITGHGRPGKMGRLSRSLSRSRSTRNLQQSLALLSTLEQGEPQMPQQLLDHKRTPSGSLPSMPFVPPITHSELATINSKSSPTMFRKEYALPISDFEKYTGLGTESLLAMKTKSVKTETKAAVAVFPPDEISKNVYRSYEMQLPESCSIGRITPSHTSNSNSKIEDDYNYDVFTCAPLYVPPRLPNAMETYEIAERSKEEKTNWGWYA